MDTWASFRRLADLPSAQALVEVLLTHEVPARIEAPCLLPGIDGYYIVAVPLDLLHRAGWVAPDLGSPVAVLAERTSGADRTRLEDDTLAAIRMLHDRGIVKPTRA